MAREVTPYHRPCDSLQWRVLTAKTLSSKTCVLHWDRVHELLILFSFLMKRPPLRSNRNTRRWTLRQTAEVPHAQHALWVSTLQ